MKIGLLSDETDLAAFSFGLCPSFEGCKLRDVECNSSSLSLPYSELNSERENKGLFPTLLWERKKMNKEPRITDIKRAYHQAAKIVDKHGEKYLPIFERIEAEYQHYIKRKDLLTKAKEISSSIDID